MKILTNYTNQVCQQKILWRLHQIVERPNCFLEIKICGVRQIIESKNILHIKEKVLKIRKYRVHIKIQKEK